MFLSKYLATYRQKNIALLGATLLFGILIYFASIQRTISNYQAYQQKKEQLSRVSNASQLITQYRSQLSQLQEGTQQSYNRENLAAAGPPDRVYF